MSIITKNSELSKLCQHIRSSKCFALDLEFIPELTYEPELALVQVATDSQIAIVDPLTMDTLNELWELVCDPDILVVIHAASEDLDIVYQLSGTVPQNISDTQISAGFAGYGYPVGYGKLLQTLLGVFVAKTESYTNWTQRPLRDEQITYAIDDVKHLLALHRSLEEVLKQKGRLDWVKDECQKYSSQKYYEQDISRAFMKIKGSSGLKSRELAVLQELCSWRHQEAASTNKPLRSILPDNILLAFAKHPPKELSQLERIRGVRTHQLNTYSNAILAAVQKALNLPQDKLPTWPAGKVPNKRDVLIADYLFILLKMIVFDLDIAPELVVTRSVLEALVRAYREKRLNSDEFLLLQGWRYDLVGKHIMAALEGKSCIIELTDEDKPVKWQFINAEINNKQK